MAKHDIKNAYYSTAILKKHQQYLRFMFGGKIY